MKYFIVVINALIINCVTSVSAMNKFENLRVFDDVSDMQHISQTSQVDSLSFSLTDDAEQLKNDVLDFSEYLHALSADKSMDKLETYDIILHFIAEKELDKKYANNIRLLFDGSKREDLLQATEDAINIINKSGDGLLELLEIMQASHNLESRVLLSSMISFMHNEANPYVGKTLFNQLDMLSNIDNKEDKLVHVNTNLSYDFKMAVIQCYPRFSLDEDGRVVRRTSKIVSHYNKQEDI